ncbi:lipopolysaccharide/colanic/teichoic acid biosynthesis glycosyltransferase [Demequina lutea]|uniref:Lipopolysaccharide/colanic/teichoic acid biosynthesis glycosyltransferase n=1 Tax=Demequina lutea TaxID=431489 RepID=A0A7Z0CHS2_9MICO|nr:lipopolysaccharide/colanic/teichoic acid biosynthesis glycosyltransferase [Demequina lutea]
MIDAFDFEGLVIVFVMIVISLLLFFIILIILFVSQKSRENVTFSQGRV